MRTRRLAAGAMVGVLASLVVGCQGSDPAANDALGSTPTPAPVSTPVTTSAAPPPTPSPTPTVTKPSTPPDTISRLSAAAILRKTQAAAKAADSVQMKGSLTDGKDRIVLDVGLGKAGGQGSISVNGASMSVIVIGRTAYLKMSDKFWRAQTKSQAEADALVGLIAGRWIKTSLSNKELQDFAAFGSKSEFFDTLFEPSGTLRKTAPRTVDGVESIGLRDPDGTLWVDTATARPVRLESSSTDALSFSDYNQVPAPKAPPTAQVIDGKALGI
ncbi:hypothetical protein [Kribbella shirazensis]|uniref:Lipoprotein n=1 Tax=Kribbella shirazensis TaxID=1105143 RepID=A0A7X5VCJ4_9ACTN|nr:hypothetical protein [Kribbella shirazensis]NIK58663.1 hypothetical protein [Kribbella shirazensis]